MCFIRKIITVTTCLLAITASGSFPAQANDNNTILVLELGKGNAEIRLRPDLASAHVEQIKQLVRDGSYDNVVFHRVIKGFMAQTGDVQYGNLKKEYNPGYVGTGQSKYKNLPAEFSSEPFKRGTVGMARSRHPDSANSQFFICLEDAPFLNSQYTVIGHVIRGMDAVDAIRKGNTGDNGKVHNPDYIIKATLVEAVR